MAKIVVRAGLIARDHNHTPLPQGALRLSLCAMSDEKRRALRTEKRAEKILASPQFKDGRFHNTAPVGPGLKNANMLSTAAKFFFGGERRVPSAPLPAESPLDRWRKAAASGLRATWLGHSTVLLEVDGLRVLTDPVWGLRASPSSHLGPKRFQPVPVAIAELPPLDAVIVSHDHYDHLCKESIAALAERDVPFITSLGVGARLESFGVRPDKIVELDWWESAQLGALTITAAPSQHFSGRGVGDRNSTLWSSFVARGPRHAVFFSGDTGLTDEYTFIRDRLGPFDLVLLEVGAFHPSWGDIHLGPDNALKALELLGGGVFLPVHWGTFNLGLHAWDEPAETLLAHGKNVPLAMPKLGVPFEPTRIDQVDPWWRAISMTEKRGAHEPPPDEVEIAIANPID